MARPDTKDEQTILQNLWILGFERPEGVSVPCGDASSARRLRFALYNAVKQFKGDGAKDCSERLANAISNCSLAFTDDGAGIVIQQKVATKVNKAILAVLGDFPLLSEEDRQVQESSQRFQALVTQAPGVEESKQPQLSLAALYGARA